MSNIPSRDQFLFTESFDSLMNNNNVMLGGRDKPSPGDALHQEALEYLKTTLKLKELEARAYKSIAYRHIKESQPELKHFERAEKMLELVKSKNFTKEYKDKLADTMKILEDIDSEKAKRHSESASNTEEKVARRLKGKPRRSSKQRGGYDSDTFSETSIDMHYTDSNANKPFFNEYRAMKTQYLQSKLKQNGGNNFSETSVMQNYTESNANQPFYKEYLEAKSQYLQAKLNQSGSSNNFSETSMMQNYTESNANQPYYKEYLQAKSKYLQSKLNQSQSGGAFDMGKWGFVQPTFGMIPQGPAVPVMQLPNMPAPPGYIAGTQLNPTSPLHDLARFMEIIKEELMPNLMQAGAAGAAGAIPAQHERNAAIAIISSYIQDIRNRWGIPI